LKVKLYSGLKILTCKNTCNSCDSVSVSVVRTDILPVQQEKWQAFSHCRALPMQIAARLVRNFALVSNFA
jgi:hypothetical protein